LKVEGSYENGVLFARFAGTADLETKDDLVEVVRILREASLAQRPDSVVIDFRELEFMNSSSFKVFVAWLATVQDLPPERQYKITLRSNPNLHWQRRSLAALSCFAAELIAIEI
jgi:hypothetical protein